MRFNGWFVFFWCCHSRSAVNVFLLLRLERKLASKAFTAPHHRPDPDAAPSKTPLEIAEEKREALKFLAGYESFFATAGFFGLKRLQIFRLG